MTKTEAYDLVGMESIELFAMSDAEMAQCAAGPDGYRGTFYACVSIAWPDVETPRAVVAVWLDVDDVVDIIAENPTVPVYVPVPWHAFDTASRVQPYDYERIRAKVRSYSA